LEREHELDMDKPVRYSSTKIQRDDRRRSMRHPILGAVHFQWRSAGKWYDGVRTTRDIGKGGVFVESGSIPLVASELKLTVTIAGESTSDATLQLVGVGVVRNVRQESCQEIGFGASADFHVEAPESRKAKR
jgi:hypothetical protein